ncbi:MAG: DUF502 domain-containing protein [Alphaproteobacteria bacterium]
MSETSQTPDGQNDGLAGPPPKLPSARVRLLQKLRAYFLTGVLVTAPLGLTIYLAWIFIDFVDNQITPLFPDKYNPENYLPFAIPGIGLLVAIIGLTIIGAVTAGFFGRALIRASERILARMPVIRNIYSVFKQLFETVLADQSKAFREVVLLEYPRRDIWAVGFLTSGTKGEVGEKTDKDMVNVFLPTTPNPTSGYLLFVPREDVITLEMTVEEGIKLVVSAGIITPPTKAEKVARAAALAKKKGR